MERSKQDYVPDTHLIEELICTCHHGVQQYGMTAATTMNVGRVKGLYQVTLISTGI